MSLFRDLYSRTNLRLAWTRIRTASNIEYKNEYREVYDSYEIGLDENLASLSYALKHHTYKPSGSERYMKPKPSGLLRPYTLLNVEDQIVYQAFANILIRRFWTERTRVQNVVAFSNSFQGTDSEFMCDPWRDCLARFNRRISNLKSSGKSVCARFDLSAYFDTISHDLLIHQIAPTESEEDFCDLFATCLKTWTPRRIRHGIPQGPAASAVFAELFMLPVDEAFRVSLSRARYARYVDDVYIVGRTATDVQREVIRLDEMCRELGLIPHADKFEAGSVGSSNATGGVTPSLAETDFSIPASQGIAESKFIGALNGRRSKIQDSAVAKFVLFRARPSAKITKKVLDLLLVHPEHCDAFGEYLKRVTNSRQVVSRILPLVRNGMTYDRQEATYWDVVWSVKTPAQEREIIEAAMDRSPRLPGSFRSTKLAIYRLLMSSRSLPAIQYAVNMLASEESPALISRAIGTIPPSILYAEQAANFLVTCLLGANVDSAITAATLIGRSRSDASALLNGLENINPAARVTLERLGVLPASKPRRVPSFSTQLSRRYKTPTWHGWQSLLGREHVWANEQLAISERWFGNRDYWMGVTDALCNLIVEDVFAWMHTNHPSERAPKIVDSKGNRIDYGSLLEARGYLRTKFPKLYLALSTLHSRRNKLPSSHHRDKRTGRLSRQLTKFEQNKCVALLSDGFREMISVLTAMGLR